MKNSNEVSQKYANKIMYSDVEPFEIIGKRAKTILIIRKMDTNQVDNPNFQIGGFCAHSDNKQSYEYISNSKNYVIEIRQLKKEYIRRQFVNDECIETKYHKWQDKHGNKYELDDKPFKFYDYNF